MRIFDVSGPTSPSPESSDGGFLDPIGARTRTQDLTFNNAPLLELRDLATTVQIFRIRERHFRDPENIAPELEKRDDADLQLAPGKLPNRHFLGYEMHSQSAYRWGDAVVKYALFPAGALQQEDLADREEWAIKEGSQPAQHRLWLREYFRSHDAEYELRVQVCEDLAAQSVEDAGTEWDREKFPFVTVGRVVLHRGQDSWSAERRAFWDDEMRLNVWYGLEAHRPLGSVNRLRRRLYECSARNREEINGRKVGDVGSIEQIPD